MYADDCIVYFTSNDINQLYSKFNSSLDQIYIWLNCNNLTLNFYKTEYVIISLKTLKSDFKLIFNDHVIQKLNSFKFLGLTIISQLKFHKNISDVVYKASKPRGILMRLKYLPKNILITLYYSFVWPYLFYF